MKNWKALLETPQPPASKLDLDAVETELGFKIPTQLRKLYGQVGGGRFGNKRIFYNEDDREFSILDLITFEKPASTHAVFVKNFKTRDLIPFGLGPVGDHFCIDTKKGTVVFYAHDTAFKPRKLVTDSLASFLDNLVESDDGDEEEEEP